MSTPEGERTYVHTEEAARRLLFGTNHKSVRNFLDWAKANDFPLYRLRGSRRWSIDTADIEEALASRLEVAGRVGGLVQ